MNAKLALAVFAAGAAVAAASAAEDAAARAARLHQDAIVVDTHQDVPEALEEKWGAYADWHDIGEPGATKHVDLPRLRAGRRDRPLLRGLRARVLRRERRRPRAALELSDMVDAMVARHPADLVPAASVAESAGPRARAASRSSRGSRAATPSRTPWEPCAGSTGWACAT